MSTAEQWETATVRVEDVHPGWQISFGGLWLPVGQTGVLETAVDVIFKIVASSPVTGELCVAIGTMVQIRRRADPELVEIMARAAFEADGSVWAPHETWSSTVRRDTSAAIAAARAAGWRIERAS